MHSGITKNYYRKPVGHDLLQLAAMHIGKATKGGESTVPSF